MWRRKLDIGSPISLVALGYGVAVNLAGFGLLGWDKSCAFRGRRRVPEARLLSVAALGGAPAMLLGRWLLRHKTKKQPFATYLTTIFSIQVLVAIALLLLMLGRQDWRSSLFLT
ncbi:DUF1294 domain-containing protein [Hoeflea sp. YIM 152468]|uniref:DUF1294 domain-containing protein n=1 Tax=Hoeflea sp. YIM 152468 TaxID=3031759 RepID=UPI0023DB40E1|nr:DUF1294 domain-containing protein [Hoeflea sp. YIM 152468]MDF1608172.1 DUF1294 domain-containing protein [Hoeflea sp. YIM 152468]